MRIPKANAFSEKMFPYEHNSRGETWAANWNKRHVIERIVRSIAMLRAIIPINLLPISNIAKLISRSIRAAPIYYENIPFHSIWASRLQNIRMYFFFIFSWFFSFFLSFSSRLLVIQYTYCIALKKIHICTNISYYFLQNMYKLLSDKNTYC